MSKQLIYREDEVVAANLEVVAEQNRRTVSDELRAATSIYLALVNLAHLRLTVPAPGMADEIARIERSIKTEIGQALLAALPNDVRSAFEKSAGVDYPTDHFGQIHVPFDRLLDWLAAGAG